MKCVYLRGESQVVAGIKINAGCNALTESEVEKLLNDNWGKKLFAAEKLSVCVTESPEVEHKREGTKKEPGIIPHAVSTILRRKRGKRK